MLQTAFLCRILNNLLRIFMLFYIINYMDIKNFLSFPVDAYLVQ